MILIIDAANTDKINLCLFSQNKNIKESNYPVQKGQLEELLPAIDDFLLKNNLSLKDLKAIAVNHGPGSYTSLRITVTTANTLAKSLNIPIFGFHNEKYIDIADKIINELKKQRLFNKPIVPHYPRDL